MLCRPAEAVIRPAAPSHPVQTPRSRPSGPDVAVQPAVAVRRGDPLRLAPVEQRGDHRVRAAERLEPPGPGVGHVDADLAEQLADLRRVAEVDVSRAGDQAADRVVASGPGARQPPQRLPGARPTRSPTSSSAAARSSGRPRRPSSTASSSAADSDHAVSTARRGRTGLRRRPSGSAAELVLVHCLHVERGGSPARRCGRRRRSVGDPAGPEMPVRAHRLVRVGRVTGRPPPPASRSSWPVRGRPSGSSPRATAQTTAGSPVGAAVQQPVARRDVPGRRHPAGPGRHRAAAGRRRGPTTRPAGGAARPPPAARRPWCRPAPRCSAAASRREPALRRTATWTTPVPADGPGRRRQRRAPRSARRG